VNPTDTTLLAIFALPILGFALGALWMRGRTRHERVRHPQEVTPVPLVRDGVETQMLDALDSVQAQLAELAERQDFTERMMAERELRMPRHGDTPVPTPV
jgi:hypothetical protein